MNLMIRTDVSFQVMVDFWGGKCKMSDKVVPKPCMSLFKNCSSPARPIVVYPSAFPVQKRHGKSGEHSSGKSIMSWNSKKAGWTKQV